MKKYTGACMCGQVKYEISGEVFGVVSCHCKYCQRLHGNYNPMVVAEKTDFSFTNDAGIGWYESSPENERGFCKNCGAAMFKRPKDGPKILISVGSLDDTSSLKNVKNIFTEEVGRYYVLPPEESH
jgi:hypothetical protein